MVSVTITKVDLIFWFITAETYYIRVSVILLIALHCFHQIGENMEQFHIGYWQPDLLQHNCILQKLGDWHQATQKLKTWITQLAAADSRAGNQKSCFN